MKKIIDERTNRKQTVYLTYKLQGDSCPECGRILKERDYDLLNQVGRRQCVKCGAILVK